MEGEGRGGRTMRLTSPSPCIYLLPCWTKPRCATFPSALYRTVSSAGCARVQRFENVLCSVVPSGECENVSHFRSRSLSPSLGSLLSLSRSLSAGSRLMDKSERCRQRRRFRLVVNADAERGVLGSGVFSKGESKGEGDIQFTWTLSGCFQRGGGAEGVGWWRDCNWTTRGDMFVGVVGSISGFRGVALWSGCVGGTSGTSSESAHRGVRVRDDASCRCGGSGGIDGPFDGAGSGAGRLYTDTTAVVTCSNDRADGAVDAEGLRLHCGGSLRPRTSHRAQTRTHRV